MPGWVWIIANTTLGLPIALSIVVLAREALRAVLAVALGFRVFELQWGVGRRVASFSLGPVDLRLAPWPIAGATIARSGSPRRHRLGRALLAGAPLFGQGAWLAYRLATGTPPGTAPIFEGPAPLACLDLANTVLLVGHATLAFEVSAFVRTDIRMLLDAFLGRADSDRAARANYYARLAHHHLERARVASAREALENAITQLGPERLLVACQACLESTDLESVVDQGECADAMAELIRKAEPRRQVERASWGLAERARQGFFSALPLSAAILALTFVQADRLARSVEAGMLALGDAAIASGETDRCEALIDRWSAWSAKIDPWLPPDAVDRSDRHLGLARLERCRGDVRAAANHHGEALLAANAASQHGAATLGNDPVRWLENELRIALLLRQAAEVENDRHSFRQALLALGRAERKLDTLGGQLALLPDTEARDLAEGDLDAERERVRAMREQVLASMTAH